MLDNYDRIMKKDASCYITEMCNAYEKSNNGITSYPLVEYLLSSVLLRLTGFMEQKLDTLQLILCGNSADFRYNLLRNRNALSSNYDVVKNIYSKFCNLINEIDKTEFCQTQKRYEKSIFSNQKQMQRAYKKVFDIFKNHPIANHIKRKFDDFKEFGEYFSDYNQEYANTLQKLKDTATSQETKRKLGIYLTELKKKIKTQKTKSKKDIDFSEIYTQTIKFRHSIAHNLSSVQVDLPTITYIKSHAFRYENYFIRYMIILCLDEIFRDMYLYYNNTKTQYLR